MTGIISSCTTTLKTTGEKILEIPPLQRTDYTISDDKVSEATVTTYFGLLSSSNTGRNYKQGKFNTGAGKITIGTFNIDLIGLLAASAVTVAGGYLLSNYNFNDKVLNFGKHSNKDRYMSSVPAYGTCFILGFGLNSVLFPAHVNSAGDLAKYNLLNENKFDYVLNPRYDIVRRNFIFKKTATVKITAKGINIITNK